MTQTTHVICQVSYCRSIANCRLAVKGAVRANEVVVDTGWSDYVFDKDYRNAPLTEVKKYIEQNHHLPGMPSAQQVAQQGVSVGEMQAKLLAKIEELTLHLINDEEKIARLEKAHSQEKK